MRVHVHTKQNYLEFNDYYYFHFNTHMQGVVSKGVFTISIYITRPKPVGHGYVFSMAVGTIGEWMKVVPFFVRVRTVDLGGGGGWQFF